MLELLSNDYVNVRINKSKMKCGLTWSVLLLRMSTRNYSFSKHFFLSEVSRDVFGQWLHMRNKLGLVCL